MNRKGLRGNLNLSPRVHIDVLKIGFHAIHPDHHRPDRLLDHIGNELELRLGKKPLNEIQGIAFLRDLKKSAIGPRGHPARRQTFELPELSGIAGVKHFLAEQGTLILDEEVGKPPDEKNVRVEISKRESEQRR